MGRDDGGEGVVMMHSTGGKPVRRVRRVRTARPVVPGKWKGWVALAVLAVGALYILTIIIGMPVLASYDKAHLESMDCLVTSATNTQAQYNGHWVAIETSDCGQLALRGGVTRANSDEIAAQINVGGKFTFEIGAATRSMKGLFQSINITPAVYSFKKM